jgi:hypothetical protein
MNVKGTITNLNKTASVEWRIKHCYSSNLDEDIKKWTYETHYGTLTCGSCNKEPFITGFNLEEKIIKCPLCGTINKI